MKHNIYNADQHIDFNKIEKLLNDNASKEIICFGGGTAAQILSEKLLHKYNVTCFLDNNDKIWGTEICGCKVCEPSILKDKTRDSYIVLILSKHAVQISKQLEGFGLKKDVDYFDIYKEFSTYFRIKKFEGNVLKFLDFIDRIPKGTLDNVEKKQGAKAGIVCSGSMAKNAVCYAIGQCLVSMYHGYDATLIVDTLKGYDDYIYFDTYSVVVRVYIEYVINYIRNFGIDINVEYISAVHNEDLTDVEMDKLNYLSEVVLYWLDSREDEVFLKDDTSRNDVSKTIMYENYKHIKAFFSENKYDVLSVFTGIHKHRGLYTLYTRLNDIRVVTYDGGYDWKVMTISTNGISTQSPDINKIVKEPKFSEQELEKIFRASSELIQERQGATISDNQNVKNNMFFYQIVSQSEDVKGYDILVPLNIFWDSAALWVDNVFYNWIEWLKDLIEYVYSNTDATMLIREHPAQRYFSGFNYVDLKKTIGYDEKKHGQRIRIVKAEEELNTYSYLKKAKVVLPYTSTVGLESVVAGKPVIMHTNIYYSNTDFVMTANSKEEYFSLINKMLNLDTFFVDDEQKKKALLAFYLKMNDMLPTVFTEALTVWMEKDFLELCQEDGVLRILDCLYHEIPVCYSIVRKAIN